MKPGRALILSMSGVLGLFLMAASVVAVETSGESGSASGTTTVSGKQLPAPDPEWGGEIKADALSSKAWWPPRIVPPKMHPIFY